jgi:hypothetical protein
VTEQGQIEELGCQKATAAARKTDELVVGRASCSEGALGRTAMMSAANGGQGQSILDLSVTDVSNQNSRFRDARSQIRTGSSSAGPTPIGRAAANSVGSAPPTRWTAAPFPRPAGTWLAEWESHQGDFTDVFKILRRLLLATAPGEVAMKFGVRNAHALLSFDAFGQGASPRLPSPTFSTPRHPSQ